MKETHQTIESEFGSGDLLWQKEHYLPSARLAQSVEHETLNLRVVGSSPTLGDIFCTNQTGPCTSAPWLSWLKLFFAGKRFQVLPRFELGSQDSES